MNAIVLPRVSWAPNMQLDQQVAKDAFHHFNYEPAVDLVREQNLLAILADLGVSPFAPAAVAGYKRQKLLDMRAQQSWLVRHLPLNPLRWRICSIRAYDAPIPESVLRLAVQIRMARGFAELAVDYLSTINLDQRRAVLDEMYDPFLVVRANRGAPWHHVAVWDEPTFAG